MKKLIAYLIRWQLSTLVLAPCIYFITYNNVWIKAAIANLIGGLLFYKIDKFILRDKQKRKNE